MWYASMMFLGVHVVVESVVEEIILVGVRTRWWLVKMGCLVE